jgi:ribonuclease HII
MGPPLLKYEKELWDKGLAHIAGVDEAGRGPLAGPLVVAAVILNKDHLHARNYDVVDELWEMYNLINDSKLVTEKRRNKLFKFIVTNSITLTIEEIPHGKIDEWGISRSNQIGFYNAVNRLRVTPQHILTDHYGINAIAEERQTNIKRGDCKSISIAAASIIAKVHRDKLMLKYHEEFPEYGFDKHKGYGTRFHRDQIMRTGPCEIHRRSFEPVKSL